MTTEVTDPIGPRQIRHATVDFDEISWLRKHSPGWKLLCADNAPLILSFFEKVFVEENIRSISAADLASRLDDELYALNERPNASGPAFPKPAKAYLEDWAATPAAPPRRPRPGGREQGLSVMMAARAWFLWKRSGWRENRHDHHQGRARAPTRPSPACRYRPGQHQIRLCRPPGRVWRW